jgi:CheY-like chemotaxis protein
MMKVVEILLIEDNRGDVVLLQEALAHIGWAHHLSLAQDGMEALAILRRRNGFAGAPRPDLIVLDLNLPLMSGREVLAEIRPDPDLGLIPVVILTSSKTDYDLLRTYGLPENAYIVKPFSFEGYVETGRQIQECWQRTSGELKS